MLIALDLLTTDKLTACAAMVRSQYIFIEQWICNLIDHFQYGTGQHQQKGKNKSLSPLHF